MARITPAIHPMKPVGSCLVRAATPDDAAAVLECAREAFETSRHTLTQADEFTMTLEQEREFLAATLSHQSQLFLLALDSPPASTHDTLASESTARAASTSVTSSDIPARVGAVLGILSARARLPKRKLRHTVELGMSVRSSHRARGIGTALMAEAVRWAQAHPEIEIMTLGVYADNTAGRALYRKFGFIDYSLLPDGCKHDDGSTWDQIEMYRRV